ncbi:MAG TPA: lipopolysaccharide kinase InaA family protein [Gemmatimonadaceae bacterium]|nr:lipopolysaccharide kinase InaA family protein [Gemmatimonadaceae bacterium]
MTQPLPRDFSRFHLGHSHVVAHESCVPWIGEVLPNETLYSWAARHPGRRELPGRVPAYSVPLPAPAEVTDANLALPARDSGAESAPALELTERRVVVRHSRHGGLLGPLRGDLFFPPTRAPYELLVSHLLASAGIRTPPVVAIAVYRAGALMRRSDVVTMELPGRDLGSALLDEPDEDVRRTWVAAVAGLVQSLSGVGAWHPDLNVRNVLLVERDPGSVDAFVLDVDRIRFVPPGDPHVRDANLDRLERSVRKWRGRHGVGFHDDELRALRSLAAEPAPA